MLPSTIQWYFPTEIKEAVKLIKETGIILHGGGTKILEPQPRSSIKGLVDVGNLGLNYVTANGSTIHIGAGATFADVVQFCRKTKRLPALGESLSHAASTPLRNRITIGGSLRDFPLWSNLYAPLLALDAQIEIAGERTGTFPLEEYATSQLIRSKHLIKEVNIAERAGIRCAARTFHVVRFEYPLFTIAVALKIRKNVISEIRVFITGVQKKFARIDAAEKALHNRVFTPELIEEAVKKVSLTFVPDFKFSPAYKERVAKICLRDILLELREEVV